MRTREKYMGKSHDEFTARPHPWHRALWGSMQRSMSHEFSLCFWTRFGFSASTAQKLPQTHPLIQLRTSDYSWLNAFHQRHLAQMMDAISFPAQPSQCGLGITPTHAQGKGYESRCSRPMERNPLEGPALGHRAPLPSICINKARNMLQRRL